MGKKEARKLSVTPPKKIDRLKDFIEEPDKIGEKQEAESTPEQEGKSKKYPWDKANEEIIKPFNLRLKLPDKMKAEFIVDNTLEYKSLHDFCMKAILKNIDKELKKLL